MEQQKPLEVNLSLTIDEVNGIIAVLANLPFNQVHDLVNKVRSQAIAQLQVIEAEAAKAQAEAKVETETKSD